MAIEIKVPTVGESISEVTLVKWLKQDGEWAERDEVIAELESEKATFEINAEKAGAVKQVAKEGDTLAIGDLVCTIDTDAVKPEGGKVEEKELIDVSVQKVDNSEQKIDDNKEKAAGGQLPTNNNHQKLKPLQLPPLLWPIKKWTVKK